MRSPTWCMLPDEGSLSRLAPDAGDWCGRASLLVSGFVSKLDIMISLRWPETETAALTILEMMGNGRQMPEVLVLGDFAGISRDSLHKRRLTGGKQNKWRKKRK